MTDQEELQAAARAGDEAAFGELVERYRGELRVHCYRMLGSFDEAEDLVQETFLRAWRSLGGFEGRSGPRAWLYRIATNACIDVARARRVLPHHLAGPSDPSVAMAARPDIAWLQPFPDSLWEPAAPSQAEPGEAVVARETIELAFLAAIQLLPPRQRAAVILSDVLGWPAKQTAQLLEGSVASVHSALQRGRATLQAQLPERRSEWAPPAAPSEEERAVLRRYMDAMERADVGGIAALLAADVRATMPPWPIWYQGRAAVVESLKQSFAAGARFRMVATRANGRPAVAAYLREGAAYHAFAISVIRIAGGEIVELTAFHDVRLFAAFGLPMDR